MCILEFIPYLEVIVYDFPSNWYNKQIDPYETSHALDKGFKYSGTY